MTFKIPTREESREAEYYRRISLWTSAQYLKRNSLPEDEERVEQDEFESGADMASWHTQHCSSPEKESSRAYLLPSSRYGERQEHTRRAIRRI